jgi:hypothetical protein
MASKIMSYLNDDRLIELGKYYHVDKTNHKVTGAFILKAFVKSVLNNRPVSLRSIEVLTRSSSDLNSLLKTNNKDKAKLDHSSLGKRLNKVSVNYFAAIYEDLVAKSSAILANSKNCNIHRFDSTILTLCGKIIKDGINVGGYPKDTQIKMSIGLKGNIPANIRFCKGQSDVSEDVALTKAINEAKLDKEDIILFDRGIAKGETFNDFSKRDLKFITRINSNRRYEVIKKNQLPQEIIFDSKLKIISDEIINLYYRKTTIKNDLRLIRAINDSGTEILFLTNLNDPSAIEIANSYKLRWDIEVFFKFLKQHLQFKHFIAHSLNGMMVYIYSILIAAILFTIFKHQNNLTGFKIALLQFTQELEKEIIADLVILSGGDPNKLKGIL